MISCYTKISDKYNSNFSENQTFTVYIFKKPLNPATMVSKNVLVEASVRLVDSGIQRFSIIRPANLQRVKTLRNVFFFINLVT